MEIAESTVGRENDAFLSTYPAPRLSATAVKMEMRDRIDLIIQNARFTIPLATWRARAMMVHDGFTPGAVGNKLESAA